MKLRGYKLWALFKKDLRLATKNKSILIMLALPIGFTLLYNSIITDMMVERTSFIEGFVILFMQVLAISTIPLTTQSIMIAEEKEKNTMRTLMLSDVSSMEFLLSKSLVSYIYVIVVSMIVFFLCKVDIMFLPVNLLLVSLASITIILFGSMVGILSKDQTSANTLSTPAMLLFMMPTLLAEFFPAIEKIAYFIPTYSFQQVYLNYMNEISLLDMDNIIPILIMIAWIVIGSFLFRFVYRKNSMDN